MKTFRITIDITASTEEEARNLVRKFSDKVTEETQDQYEDLINPKGGRRYLGNTALSLIAVTECFQNMGMLSVRPSDPLLPFLTKLADEQLAHDQTLPLEIPPEGWVEPEHWDENTTDNWAEVKPGDPRYPGPDEVSPPLRGAMTGREHAALSVYSTYHNVSEAIRTFSQYIPDLMRPTSEPGELEFSEVDVRLVLREFIGFPEHRWGKYDLSMAKVWAITWWAYKKSNHWPTKLTTLEDLLNNFPTVIQQYEKYYTNVPEGKRPHELLIGKPARCFEENEESTTGK